MDYTLIVEWVVRIILIVYSVITTVLFVVKNIKAKKAAGETVDVVAETKNAALNCIDLIKQAENMFESITKSDVKCGALKLNSVLAELERDIRNKGQDFDVAYYKEFIARVVSAMNVDVQSTGQVIDDENNKVIGDN